MQVDNSVQVAEQRVRELRAKIEVRRSQMNLPISFPTRYSAHMLNLYRESYSAHMLNLYRELSAAAAIVIAGRFDPLEVLDRMGWK